VKNSCSNSKALSDRFHADIGTDVLCVDRELIYARTGKKNHGTACRCFFSHQNLLNALSLTQHK